MADDMDRLFENFGFGSGLLAPVLGAGPDLAAMPWRDASSVDRTAWSPQVETFRRGDELVVRADLPGLKKEDVTLELDDPVPGVESIGGTGTRNARRRRHRPREPPCIGASQCRSTD